VIISAGLFSFAHSHFAILRYVKHIKGTQMLRQNEYGEIFAQTIF